MSVNNLKHRIFGGLGRIGIPLLLLLLFTWGVPQTAEARYHGRSYGHHGRFVGHRGHFVGYRGHRFGHRSFFGSRFGYSRGYYPRYHYAPSRAAELARATRAARLSGLGALDINIKPKKTAVYVDGQYVGVVSDFDGSPGYLWLKKGTHQLVFYKDGYRTLAREYTIHPGVVIDVSSVQPGKRVVVRLNESIPGKKVKGTFVASDAEGITVRAKDGQELAVPWFKVRRLAANRKARLRLETGESLPPQAFAAGSAQ